MIWFKHILNYTVKITITPYKVVKNFKIIIYALNVLPNEILEGWFIEYYGEKGTVIKGWFIE